MDTEIGVRDASYRLFMAIEMALVVANRSAT
jgi:hypothetical protein